MVTRTVYKDGKKVTQIAVEGGWKDYASRPVSYRDIKTDPAAVQAFEQPVSTPIHLEGRPVYNDKGERITVSPRTSKVITPVNLSNRVREISRADNPPQRTIRAPRSSVEGLQIFRAESGQDKDIPLYTPPESPLQKVSRVSYEVKSKLPVIKEIQDFTSNLEVVAEMGSRVVKSGKGGAIVGPAVAAVAFGGSVAKLPGEILVDTPVLLHQLVTNPTETLSDIGGQLYSAPETLAASARSNPWEFVGATAGTFAKSWIIGKTVGIAKSRISDWISKRNVIVALDKMSPLYEMEIPESVAIKGVQLKGAEGSVLDDAITIKSSRAIEIDAAVGEVTQTSKRFVIKLPEDLQIIPKQKIYAEIVNRDIMGLYGEDIPSIKTVRMQELKIDKFPSFVPESSQTFDLKGPFDKIKFFQDTTTPLNIDNLGLKSITPTNFVNAKNAFKDPFSGLVKDVGKTYWNKFEGSLADFSEPAKENIALNDMVKEAKAWSLSKKTYAISAKRMALAPKISNSGLIPVFESNYITTPSNINIPSEISGPTPSQKNKLDLGTLNFSGTMNVFSSKQKISSIISLGSLAKTVKSSRSRSIDLFGSGQRPISIESILQAPSQRQNQNNLFIGGLKMKLPRIITTRTPTPRKPTDTYIPSFKIKSFGVSKMNFKMPSLGRKQVVFKFKTAFGKLLSTKRGGYYISKRFKINV